MIKKNIPYTKILVCITFTFIFLSFNAASGLNTNTGSTNSSITFNVDVQYILAQPGDILHFIGHASGTIGSSVQGFLQSNSTYIPSNTTYTPQILTNSSIPIYYQVSLPKDVPLGNQSITVGVFTQDNQIQSRAAAQVTIDIINSTSESSRVTFIVSDNLNQSRMVQIVPHIINIGLSDNLTLQGVIGNKIQFQLLIGREYEFTIIDLSSRKQMLYQNYTVPRDNSTVVVPFNLFQTNLVLSNNNIELQFDNELNGSLPVSISFFDTSNTLIFNLNTTLTLGMSQWEQSLPTKASIIHINVGKKTLYVFQIISNKNNSINGLPLQPLTILGAILVIMGMISGSMAFHRHKKGILITGNELDEQSPTMDRPNTDEITINEITDTSTSINEI